MARATGVSRQAISHGLTELATPDGATTLRNRRPGGGRKRTVTKDATLLHDLEQLVEPLSRGDPESPLRWTCKSGRKLADELNDQGHQVSHELVANLLKELGYSLQGNRKTREGSTHPDRNAQFEYLNAEVEAFQAPGSRSFRWTPRRRNWSATSRMAAGICVRQANRKRCGCMTSKIPELGKATPYGIYDLTHNQGWVNVGIDHDTAAFAVATIRGWWRLMGRRATPAPSGADHRRWRRQQRCRGCACGRSNCKNWPMKPGWRSASAICHRAPANGTRSSIACSRSLPRTGGANR